MKRWVALAALAGALLVQGCATSAWHNYQVAEAERSEREQIDAGRIPLIKTNGDLVRENWFGYLAAGAIDVAAGVLVYRAYRDWIDDDPGFPQSSTHHHHYYPEPAATPAE